MLEFVVVGTWIWECANLGMLQFGICESGGGGNLGACEVGNLGVLEFGMECHCQFDGDGFPLQVSLQRVRIVMSLAQVLIANGDYNGMMWQARSQCIFIINRLG